MSKNKKIVIILTTIVAALVLIAGTFAWQQMMNKVNEFVGHKTGITGHDDFDPKTGLKDVYVENPSSTVVFVRVKLRETMNLHSDTWRPTSPHDWKTHTYKIHANDCQETNNAGQLFHSYFTWEMGGQKYYLPTNGSQQIVQDTTDYSSNPNAKLTPNAHIVKIADYLAMGTAQREAFTGWIYDTDGYAYWSQPLGQGDVTGLLLHKVNTSASLKNTDYYYAIDVIYEAVDKADIPMWTTGAASVDGSGTRHQEATSQGKTLINYLATLPKAQAASGSVSPAPARAVPAFIPEATIPEVTTTQEETTTEDETPADDENAAEEDETVAAEEVITEEETPAEDETTTDEEILTEA